MAEVIFRAKVGGRWRKLLAERVQSPTERVFVAGVADGGEPWPAYGPLTVHADFVDARYLYRLKRCGCLSWSYTRAERNREPVQIARDPFARASLMRIRVEGVDVCAWCGQPARFVYWWESDGSRPFVPEHRPAFCGVDCYRAYDM